MARTKVKRPPGRRGSTKAPSSNLGWWLAIGLVVVLGVALIITSRGNTTKQSGPGPKIGDHWHVAYGVNVCGNWIPALAQFESDLHTHGDGLVHAHPQSSAAAGSRATATLMFERGGYTITSEKLQLWTGKTFRSGDRCPGTKKAGEIRWALNGKEQHKELAKYVIANGDVLAIDFAPKSEKKIPTVPPSTKYMADNYATPNLPGYKVSTTTTAPAATTTSSSPPASTTTTRGA